MASNITQEKSSLTPKEVALYVGIPIASLCIAGGLYYYYCKSSSTKSSSQLDDKEDPVSSEYVFTSEKEVCLLFSLIPKQTIPPPSPPPLSPTYMLYTLYLTFNYV